MPASPTKQDEADKGPNRLNTMHQSFHLAKEGLSLFLPAFSNIILTMSPFRCIIYTYLQFSQASQVLHCPPIKTKKKYIYIYIYIITNIL